MAIFPQDKRNIENEENGVREYLEKSCRAQKRLNLSLEDFYELMILSTSGRFNEVLRAFIENGLSPQSIFYRCLQLWDNQLTPLEAKSYLSRMKAKRGQKIEEIQSDIMHHANIASRIYPAVEDRTKFSDLTAATCYIDCLPYNSSRVANQKFCDLSLELERQPIFSEYMAYLDKYKKDFQRDIDTNGRSYANKYPDNKFSLSTQNKVHTFQVSADKSQNKYKNNNFNNNKYNKRR